MSGNEMWGWSTAEINRLLMALADPTQRHLLYYFHTTANTVESFEAVQGYLSTVLKQEPDRTTLDLYHSTLPRLEETDLIDYDQRSETVRYYPDELLEHILDLCLLMEDYPKKREVID